MKICDDPRVGGDAEAVPASRSTRAESRPDAPVAAGDVRQVFVTGATGFVGREVMAQRGVLAGVKWVGMARPGADPARRTGARFEGVEWRAADLADEASLVAALAGCDTVLHMAAKTTAYTGDARLVQAVNAEGTVRIVNAAHKAGVRRFLFISSVAAVGRGTESPETVDERAAFNGYTAPLPYHASKYEAERAVLGLRDAGLQTLALNPGMIFGPGDFGLKRLKLFRVAPWLPCTEGGVTVCDVRDVARAILSGLAWLGHGRGRASDVDRMILGGETLRYVELAGALVEGCLACGGLTGPPRVGRMLRARAIPPRMLRPILKASRRLSDVTGRHLPGSGDFRFHIGRYNWFSSGLAMRELGYRARPFKETARDTAAYFRSLGVLR
jgi:dihydroflavonol-4-reductase